MVRDKIERFGVKLSPTLDADSTTHVVGRTRNTPAILEGLVRGKYIVSDSFIDALVLAMTPAAAPGSTEQALKSPLERDFDSNFPDPMEYVPPPGKEPLPRPSEFLKPAASRSNMFEGVSFIFCEDDQRTTLRTPIEVGKGKTILYPDFAVNSTTAEDFTAFVKNTARANGQGSTSKAVVVRLPLNDEPGLTLEWKRSFLQQVDLLLGQRSIVQNEFLDAVLTSNVGALCQPLQGVSTSSGTSTQARPSQPLSAPSNTQNRAEQPQIAVVASATREVEEVPAVETKVEQSPSKPSRSQKFRFTQAKSRFKGFDDFDASIVPSVSEDPDEPRPEAVNLVEEQAVEAEPQAAQSAKRNKRPASEIEALLPAATTVKRRRLQAGAGQNQDDPGQQVVEAKPSRVFRKRTIRPSRGDDGDVMDAARAKREHEQEQARLDEEINGKPLEQEEVRKIREQIAVGELPIRMPLRMENANARWDDQWNGRQNFKKFRRKGDGPQPNRGHRVIVRLEEAKRRDSTLGAVRWGTVGSNVPDTPSTVRDVDEDDNESQFRRRSRVFPDVESHRTSNESQPLEAEDDVLASAARGNVATSVASSVTRGTKRSATSRISPPAKRASNRSQNARKADDSSEGSEDDLRFKFSKRRGKAK